MPFSGSVPLKYSTSLGSRRHVALLCEMEIAHGASSGAALRKRFLKARPERRNLPRAASIGFRSLEELEAL
eukprot:5571565-Amphidinium_carterae.1